MISPVQSLDRKSSPEVLKWKGFVEEVGFESGVKE